MQQYVVIARDGSDEDALPRRKEARPFHLERAKALKATNNFVLGGALLDEEGNMRGSVMIVQFESEQELYQWLESEPYVKEKVWEDVQVKPFKVADV